MIYLDYQATTPLRPEARQAMLPFLGGSFANPHSPHRPGREAKVAVEIARTEILDALLAGSNTAPDEGRLLFTSGATEALNWAVKGAARDATRRRIVVSAVEHSAVLDSAGARAAYPSELVVLPVGRDGIVDLAAAERAIDARTALVAVMLVNNEIGTVQPIAEVGAMARAAGATMLCDAVQGFTRMPVPVDVCDLIALSAHKVGGPKGVGALWVRGARLPAPLLHGGGQEGGARSGTLSPMLCAGFGAAARASAKGLDTDYRHAARLRDRVLATLGPSWIVNGSLAERWPGNLSLRRRGVDAAQLIADVRSVAFSAGSACASGSGRPSHVLRAIGLSDAEARASIRLGFGWATSDDDADEAARLIAAAADRQLAFAV